LGDSALQRDQLGWVGTGHARFTNVLAEPEYVHAWPDPLLQAAKGRGSHPLGAMLEQVPSRHLPSLSTRAPGQRKMYMHKYMYMNFN
jgi:hypothetical protein